MSSSVSVIIPVYNQWSLTRSCLQSLAGSMHAAVKEVLLADNGSRDETVAHCHEYGKSLFGERFRVLRFQENRNFGPACNAGARAAAGDFLFFLNNDTQVQPGWLAPLLEVFANRPRTGCAGPLLLYPGSERVQHLGVAFDASFQVEHLYEHFPRDHPVVFRQRDVQCLTAAALLMPRELFLSLGGFHEGYANGCEDIDLCLQVKGKGLGLEVATQSVIHHLAEQTPGRRGGQEHNDRLLHARRSRDFRPDLHALAEQDGYRLRLTPWLETRVGLREEMRQELEARHGPQASPQALWQAVQQEPLWGEGYARLAMALSRAGDHEQACELSLLRQLLVPDMDSLKALLLAATRAGRAELAAQCRQRLETYAGMLADGEGYRRKLAGLLETARAFAEPDVMRAYTDAVQEHGQGAG